MPQIPTAPIPDPGRYPAVNPQAAGAAFDSVVRSSESAERLSLYGADAAQRVQLAEDHTMAIGGENEIDSAIDDKVGSFSERADHDKFTEDAEAAATELRQKFQARYSNNPRVWRALAPYLERKIGHLKQTVERRRLEVLTDDNKTQLERKKDSIQQKMAAAQTPEEKDIFRNEFKSIIEASVANGLITRHEAYLYETRLDLDAEKTEIIQGLRSNDVRDIVRTLDKIDRHEFKTFEAKDPDGLAAMKMAAEDRITALNARAEKQSDELSVNAAIGNLQQTFTQPDGSINYVAARKLLASKDFQTQFGLVDENGNPNRTRIQQVENYISAFQAKGDEENKAAHDKFERDIGQMYLKGDYAGVLKTLGSPDTPLSGDETRTWVNSVRERQKAAKDEKAPIKAAVAIIQANEMMRKGEDPAKIRTFIVQNAYLDKEDKEQYINKLESKLGGEVEEGRRIGYSDIKDIIVPPARGFSVDAMIQTPKQTLAIKKAQMALDSWIDSQIKANKTLTVNDIRIQAHALAGEYQPKFKDSLEYIQQQMEGMGQQTGKKK